MKKIFAVLLCVVSAACAVDNRLANSNSVNVNNTNTAAGTAKTPDKPQIKPADAVKIGAPQSIAVKAGNAAEAEFKLTIIEPFHVNSNPPSEKGFIPLEMKFESADDIEIGKPVYPPGTPKTFAFSPKPLSVYAGEITVKLPLRAAKNAVAGQKIINGKLSFQPCDDEVCYPPQKVDVTLMTMIN